MNLKARRPYLGVETDDGDLAQFSMKRGELDDTIGPKLNRRVRASGVRKLRRDGAVMREALDVALLAGEQAAEGSA